MIGRIRTALAAMYERRRSTRMSESEERKRRLPGGKDPAALKVVFQTRDDGMQPRPAPWGFLFRSPLPISLGPSQSMRINLLVSADTPMLVWPTRTHADDVKVEGPLVLSPGNEVIVTITNSFGSPLEIEAGEALVCGHPMFYSGTGEVG